jgi:hypothetical protein
MLSDHVAVAGAAWALILESISQLQLSGQVIRTMDSRPQLTMFTRL